VLTGAAVKRDDGEAGPAAAGGYSETAGTRREQADGRRRVEPRRRLIEAAIELFGTVGYAGTTIETLCARARLSTRDFYKSFFSREDLLRAVFDEQVVDRYRSIEAVLHAAPPTLEDRTRAAMADFVRGMADDPRRGRILFCEAVGVSPELEGYRRQMLRRYCHLVVEQVSAIGGDNLPTMSEAQQAMMAGFFIGGIREVMQQFTDGVIGPVSLQELVDGLTALCLQVLFWKPERTSEPPAG